MTASGDGPRRGQSVSANRMRALGLVMAVVFAVLAARAVQLSLSPAGRVERAAAAAVDEAPRADLEDRNGVLLAAMLPSYVLTARPAQVWDAEVAAQKLAEVLPRLDRALTLRRLTSKRANVYLLHDLTERDRRAVRDLGLAGIDFERKWRRVYPNGAAAGHMLGFVGRDLAGGAGLERGLDEEIRRAGPGGRPIRLSMDLRVQHAAEVELDRAARRSQAKAGAAVVLDGRSGEVLALASWPEIDPNTPGAANEQAQRNHAVGALYEMGSTIKPFTTAMALELDLVGLAERFDLSAPFVVDGATIGDLHPIQGPATIKEALAQSSNIAMAQLALRIGPARLATYLERLGLLDRATVELAEAPPPLRPRKLDRVTAATMGFGHGFAPNLLQTAGAYTVFVNGGERAPLAFKAYAEGDKPPRVRVFSALAARETLQLMRDVVVEGTARRADIEGLDIAGKTGTAEKPSPNGGYDKDRVVSSFVAVFPASAPRYVLALALDEPQRTAENGGLATGGAAAAPAVGRLAARIAPFLALSSAEAAPIGRLAARDPAGRHPAAMEGASP